MSELFIAAMTIGTGATAFMDLAALVRLGIFGTPLADYGLVGRWLASMPRGRFIHRPIAASPRVSGERTIGWAAHYLTGMGFAELLLAIFGIGWAYHPTLVPALLVGIGSVAAPFLLMQPGMGVGIAARCTPRPGAARLRSLVTHLIFGIGLYAAAWIAVALRLWHGRTL